MRKYATEEELIVMADRIVKVLDGLPVSEALTVLQRLAPSLIKDGLTVDINHPRSQEQRAELRLPPLDAAE